MNTWCMVLYVLGLFATAMQIQLASALRPKIDQYPVAIKVLCSLFWPVYILFIMAALVQIHLGQRS